MLAYKSFRALELKADAATGIFQGYAATWDEDAYGDIISPGAFTKTITERGPRQGPDGTMSSDIKILWQHDPRMPIGLPTKLLEDSKGLYVEGRIIGTECGMTARTCLAERVVDRMSIGYTVVKSSTRYDPDNGDYQGRDISELKLYEFSPVTFPANENAKITGAKGMEALLERALPLLSKKNASAVLAAIEQEGEAPSWLKSFLRALISEAEPRPAPEGVKEGTQPGTEPPSSKNDPQTEPFEVDMQSILGKAEAHTAKLAGMLAKRL